MTKTALRALIVLGALAVALTSTPAVVAQAAPACDPPTGQMSGCPVIPCPDQTDLVYSATGEPSCKPWSSDKGDPESDPTCPVGTEFQGEFGCVAEQRPEEVIGGARCGDAAQVIVAAPDGRLVCGTPAASPATAGVNRSRSAGPSAVAPAPEIQQPMVDGMTAPVTDMTAPVTDTATPVVPSWVLVDKVMEFLKAMLPWCFDRSAAVG